MNPIDEVVTDRRKSGSGISRILKEIRDTEVDTRSFEREILKCLKQMRSDKTRNENTQEEHEFIKGLILKQRADAEMRDAIKEHILKKASFTALLAILAGLVLLLKDFVTAT